MGKTLAQKIIADHLLSGTMLLGDEIGIKIDQTLTHDANSTMAYLELEAMGISRVKTELSVAYADHNTNLSCTENTDECVFTQKMATKHGAYYSRPGNGICHQVHYEKYGKPGKTLLGAASHTQTAGGLGMLAIGTSVANVAAAMGGGEFFFTMPRLIKIELVGSLALGVSAKDVSLEILRELGIKGGYGYIIEYGGEGIESLTVPDRCTIANMGIEMGAVSSIFPSDHVTKAFLESQGRDTDWKALKADEDAEYEKVITIDMEKLVPLAACPHRPDQVKPVFELTKTTVDQICIGSCSNSSLSDLLIVAAMLKNKKIADGLSLIISPGSKQVLSALSECGALTDLIDAGARVLDCACGPCRGTEMLPGSKAVSLRTFSNNAAGCAGTKDANVYLVSPETAAASALSGHITDPTYGEAVPYEVIGMIYNIPEKYRIIDNGVIPPLPVKEAEKLKIEKGPNINSFPNAIVFRDPIISKLVLKIGDNITTDHIISMGDRTFKYRNNISKLSKYCFDTIDSTFADRAKSTGSGMIVAGENYGQGSEREHAALVLLYLGIKVVIAKSFADKHHENLINAGILPLTFINPEDYDKVEQGEQLSFGKVFESLDGGIFTAKFGTEKIILSADLTDREKDIIRAGGLLKYTALNN